MTIKRALPFLLAGLALLLFFQTGATLALYRLDLNKTPETQKLLPLARRLPLSADAPTLLIWSREVVRAGLGVSLLVCSWLTWREARWFQRTTISCCVVYGLAVVIELCLFLLIEQPSLAALAGPSDYPQLRAFALTRFASRLGTLLIPLLVATTILRDENKPTSA